ncbi:MAG: 1-acyl-sn-glycerol-3-phosphate acyltransferase, partial [Bacteroidetes bacterium]|nr:1-acyl-sn-glycerol-3-phosphate acyltransferase [Bacteroidota bacterium]
MDIQTAPSEAEGISPTVFRRLFFLWAVVWGSLMTLISACGSVLSNLVVRRIGVFRWWSIFWGRSMFLGVGIRVKYHRKVDLDPSRTYVFASNHQNALDIPIAAIAVPCPFGYVAKAALERVPVLGLAIRFSPSVIVDQSHPRRSLASM